MPAIALNMSIRGQLLSGVRFNPSSLFSSSEPGVWYDPSDLTTMFQDAAGTTPVTAAGQTVALMLDKSKGLVLGPELVTNGDFSAGSTGWTISAPGANTITISGGSVRFVTNGSADTATLSQPWSGATAVGKTYRVTFDVLPGSTGTLKITTLGVNSTIGEHVFPSTPGAKSFTLISSNISTIGIARVVGQSANAAIDNISVRELAGNHATQATAASRPTYGVVPLGGRRNLLTYTEQFDNAAWLKTGGGTGTAAAVTANSVVAPDGTTTADTVVFNKGAGTTTSDISTVAQAVSTSVQTTHSIWVRADAPVTLVIRNPRNNGTYFQINVTTDWQRVSVTDPNAPVTGSNFEIGLRGGVGVVVPNTATVFLWGAQLELGSTATNYQRVTTDFDVTEAGVQSLSYLSFDGVDDFLVTPTITPNIDKVQVFAGVRKLSDAAPGMIVEHSASLTANNGTFYLIGPSSGGLANYAFGSKGTSSAGPTASGFAAPISNVVTNLGDISGDRATMRVNGTQVAQSTVDQGTGNYLAYPVYFGRRGGTGSPFNGYIYGLIVRFGANLDANTITNTETWVNGRTGAY